MCIARLIVRVLSLDRRDVAHRQQSRPIQSAPGIVSTAFVATYVDWDKTMAKQHVVCFVALLLSPLGIAGAVASTPNPGVEPSTSKPAQFHVSQKTEVPGQTLKPGSYTIQVVDHLQDRFILRIASTTGAKTALFIGVPSSELRTDSKFGPVVWSQDADGKTALRGFTFPDGKSLEFVYPKAEAVDLAKANNTHVLAVDPKSEGKVEMPKLSADDMQLITLWLLTPTPVGPGESGPGIAAARYQPASQEASAQPSASSSPQQVASVRPLRPLRPAIKSLPHTASSLPLLLLVGLVSLLGAVALRFWRMA